MWSVYAKSFNSGITGIAMGLITCILGFLCENLGSVWILHFKLYMWSGELVFCPAPSILPFIHGLGWDEGFSSPVNHSPEEEEGREQFSAQLEALLPTPLPGSRLWIWAWYNDAHELFIKKILAVEIKIPHALPVIYFLEPGIKCHCKGDLWFKTERLVWIFQVDL